MLNRVTWIYALGYLSVFIYLFLKPADNYMFMVGVWTVSSFIYPIFLGLCRCANKFMNGLAILLVLLVISQLIGMLVFVARHGSIQHHDYPTAVFFAAFLLQSIVIAAICYGIGFVVAKKFTI
jgi:hypothetical protein